MAYLAFLMLPFFFVLLVVPVLIAWRKRGPSTWFPVQIAGFFGLVAGLVVIERGTFGDLPPTMVFVVLTGFCGLSLGLTGLLLPGKTKE